MHVDHHGAFWGNAYFGVPATFSGRIAVAISHHVRAKRRDGKCRSRTPANKKSGEGTNFSVSVCGGAIYGDSLINKSEHSRVSCHTSAFDRIIQNPAFRSSDMQESGQCPLPGYWEIRPLSDG